MRKSAASSLNKETLNSNYGFLKTRPAAVLGDNGLSTINITSGYFGAADSSDFKPLGFGAFWARKVIHFDAKIESMPIEKNVTATKKCFSMGSVANKTLHT